MNPGCAAPGMNDIDGFWNTPELECTKAVEDSMNQNESEVRGFIVSSATSAGQMELVEGENYLYTSMDLNENEARNENELRDYVPPCTIQSSTIASLEKDKDLFTDKNIMACEPPEFIIHYKEKTYHVVKDICIDDGVPLKDKILTENGTDKDVCTILPPYGNNISNTEGDRTELPGANGFKTSLEKNYNNVDAYEGGTKENVKIELHIPDPSKSSSDNGFDNIRNIAGTQALAQTSENCKSTQKTMDGISGEKSVANSMPLPQNISMQKSLRTLLESPDSDGSEVEQQPAEVLCSTATSQSPLSVSAPEESRCKKAANLSYNSKVESGTITFDFKSSKAAAGGKDDGYDDVEHKQLQKTYGDPTHEVGISDSAATASEVQHGLGESSFSMAGPVSGLITYSGPITYSGSVSLRSDSSTTSTRSFAFPVLQSEWNSSPVRMAKADRRHYRRHRGWRHGLLCCRF